MVEETIRCACKAVRAPDFHLRITRFNGAESEGILQHARHEAGFWDSDAIAVLRIPENLSAYDLVDTDLS